ncbi:hypothetical protein SAMN05216593_1228 [Pseudomonas asturiensis]|uniref:Uncharacterized protein n=1 Tax=Pseudomonas asturiensis TaxID=1190415 RepID=A0A1M7QB65_9PSED|nr:DUF5677 domain-containing protein [Pseudomonas asturiensis]SHN27895.1 hypothetical protein SAMN05216593_1228 [Pseudomonas asturiensis]
MQKNELISKVSELIIDSDVAILKMTPNNKSEKITLKLWRKFIENQSATLILIERNFLAEALTVHRLSIEHLFNIFAIKKDKGYLDCFLSSAESGLSKAIKTLNADFEKTPPQIDKERISALSDQAKDIGSKEIKELGYSIYNASQKSEISHLYNNLYRVISISHAHSTYLSLISEIKEEEIIITLENMRDFLQMILLLQDCPQTP